MEMILEVCRDLACDLEVRHGKSVHRKKERERKKKDRKEVGKDLKRLEVVERLEKEHCEKSNQH